MNRLVERLKNASLSNRFSFLFGLVSFLLLVAVAAFLYRSLVAELTKREYVELASEMDLVRNLLRGVDDLHSLATDSALQRTPLDQRRLHLKLLNRTGQVYFTSSSLEVPPTVFNVPFDTGQATPVSIQWASDPHRHYQAISAWTADRKGQPLLVVLVVETPSVSSLLADYRRTLAVTVLVGTMAAAALGWFVSRRALRSLYRLATSAEGISTSRLNQRLYTASGPAELRSFASAFNAVLERIEDSYQRLSDFSSDLAHELRTPINNLLLHTQVTLSRNRTADEYRDLLESTLEEYHRLSRMAADMLFIARSDNAKTYVDLKPLNVRAEVDKVVEFFEALAIEHNVRIVCRGEATLQADRSLLQRAIVNLLSNALRHGPPETNVTVEAGCDAGGVVEIRVHDQGSGIAPEELDRVFDRFYRVSEARHNSHEDSGLGLAIVKSIMRLHGGSASVTSQPGEGTTFTLTFPPRQTGK